jgi:hypothetical protein
LSHLVGDLVVLLRITPCVQILILHSQ